MRRTAAFSLALALMSSVAYAGAPLKCVEVRCRESAERAMLEIEGVIVAPLDASAGVARKHVAAVKYDNVTFTISASSDPGFQAWVRNSFNSGSKGIDGKTDRKSGSIIVLDKNDRVLDRLEFSDAAIGGVAFPDLSADGQVLTLTLRTPELRTVDGGGMHLPQVDASRWSPADFTLEQGEEETDLGRTVHGGGIILPK